ncbi:hypothetical protein RvY_15192 [Ramazzottius varieornatus]|uniref:Uncharacterized protein n=1 Tax=Ramazzottius varieornatus TaxID=947166 RepID=A0A1D1VU26_RAMVA|nr:hypothetical protein RvY_15192 [Ramazzottius varieornatus]
MRDGSLESESRSTLRREPEGRQHEKEARRQVVSPKNTGRRGRSLSQSDICGIRNTSDYDSEAELQQSGTRTNVQRGSCDPDFIKVQVDSEMGRETACHATENETVNYFNMGSRKGWFN